MMKCKGRNLARREDGNTKQRAWPGKLKPRDVIPCGKRDLENPKDRSIEQEVCKCVYGGARERGCEMNYNIVTTPHILTGDFNVHGIEGR